jgi:trans-2,3-dihydro-3-hydroxyanthranilate isomerase
MTRLRYLHLDVFSDGPFGGHPLIVFLDPCPEPAMAALSHEFGLVVAFPLRTSPGRYRVRIFEHGHELPFGGQPTLGAAWSLGPGTWRQDSLGASVEVVVMADYARMGVPDPVLDPVSDQSLLATVEAVLGVGIDGAYRASCGGNTHLVVPVRADVAALTVNSAEVARVCEAAGMNTLSPFSWNRGEVAQRIFAPRMGIPESPAVGTAAAPAAVYARRSWGAEPDVRVRQGHGTGRASLLEVRAIQGDMTLAGAVREFAHGTCALA